jgi:cell wall-associated NlpC family hydrolase
MINVHGIALTIMLSFVGKPYKYGARNPLEGFDCSSFVIEYLKMCGLLLKEYDNTAQGLFERYSASDRESKPAEGHLIFWKNKEGHIYHVGISLNELQYIAVDGGGPEVITIEDAINKDAYVKVRFINFDIDNKIYVNPFNRNCEI